MRALREQGSGRRGQYLKEKEDILAGLGVTGASILRGAARGRLKSQLLSTPFWQGLHFSRCQGQILILRVSLVVFVAREARDFERILTLWHLKTHNFFSILAGHRHKGASILGTGQNIFGAGILMRGSLNACT